MFTKFSYSIFGPVTRPFSAYRCQSYYWSNTDSFPKYPKIHRYCIVNIYSDCVIQRDWRIVSDMCHLSGSGHVIEGFRNSSLALIAVLLSVVHEIFRHGACQCCIMILSPWGSASSVVSSIPRGTKRPRSTAVVALVPTNTLISPSTPVPVHIVISAFTPAGRSLSVHAR